MIENNVGTMSEGDNIMFMSDPDNIFVRSMSDSDKCFKHHFVFTLV